MKIICKTLFDCTYTGVTGNFRAGQIPFVTRSGMPVNSMEDWVRARNQQRNWETLLQIVSLNAQPEIIVYPQRINDTWQFEFTVESIDVFSEDNDPDPLIKLKKNCQGVPMITGLTQTVDHGEVLSTVDNKNIWFEAINIPLE